MTDVFFPDFYVTPRVAATRPGFKSCLGCKHHDSVTESESWELAHITHTEHFCNVRPTVATLRQFPFHNTLCPKWEAP